jgi:ribosomal protein L16 Arg81 hydroxylase
MVDADSSAGRGAGRRLPFTFADLISPLTVDDFRSGQWEKKHVVLHRDEPNHYADLLTLAAMDNLLATSRVRSSDLRIMKGGKETPISDLVGEDGGSYANAVESVYAEYRKGATINLLFLEQQWAPLAQLCHSLSDVLNAMFHVNVYLTPAGTQGLTEHYDTHDVFVAQVYGSKRWRLYKSPMRLPLQSQRYSRPKEGLGKPVADFVLRAGDLLYMPRGTVHEAVSNDTASLHLTIGVSPMLWSDVFRSAVERATGADIRFREALPLGFVQHEERRKLAETQAAELLDLLRESLRPRDVIAAARDRVLLTRRPSLAGHLLDLESLSTVELDTKVERRPETVWRLVDGEQEIGLEFHGKELHFPGHVTEQLRYITDTALFTAREIPGPLDENGRLVLVRTLLKEGFVTLADRPTG